MSPKMIDSILLKHLTKKYILKNFIPDNSFINLLGVRFIKENDSYISILPFRPDLIGNFEIQTLHGGVTLSLLEVTAFLQIQMRLRKNSENEKEAEDQNQLLKLVKDITSKGFVRSNYKKNLVDLSDVKITLKGKK